jgi:hypothetical protein
MANPCFALESGDLAAIRMTGPRIAAATPHKVGPGDDAAVYSKHCEHCARTAAGAKQVCGQPIVVRL